MRFLGDEKKAQALSRSIGMLCSRSNTYILHFREKTSESVALFQGPGNSFFRTPKTLSAGILLVGLKTQCPCVQSENGGLFVQLGFLMCPLANGHGSDEFIRMADVPSHAKPNIR